MIIKNKKKSFISKIFSFKLFFLTGTLAVIFLGTSLGKEYYRERQVQKEINSLKNEIESLEGNNYKLSQLIEYYKTDEFKEVEARKRLNMKKEGEGLVIVTYPDNLENQLLLARMDDNKNLPNYVKWWNYFFATKKN